MYTLTKKFRFEAAHRLAKGYKGKCANIHGHSWNGEITVTTTELDEYGFGIDFERLKKFTKEIEELLDHVLILSKDDEKLIEFCNSNGWDIMVFCTNNPTSEVIAEWIYERARRHFIGSCIFVKSITIEETCTSRCVYTRLHE